MSNNIIETFDLTKVYKLKDKRENITALNNINLQIKEGEIFALIGPNGAGKTTIINILTTLIQPTSGYAIIDGYNVLKKPNHVKNIISLMLDNSMLYNRITGYDNLKFFCKLYKIPNYKEKIDKEAKDFGLEKWLHQFVENYSSGMKMKLALLRTILINRKIMFLDEPTLGLDVKSIDLIVNKLKDLNLTIFLTSHDMNVVEKLSDRVAFINKGNILKIGTQDEIHTIMESSVKVNIDIVKNKKILKSELEQQQFINNVDETKKGLIITLQSRNDYKGLLSILNKYDIQKINEKVESLQDIFLKIM